jgi:uncharacterized protein (UPF0332 family)
MAFNWHEYLVLAQFLQSNGSNLGQVTQESAYRSAVSRAYYAAFCHSREYALHNYRFILQMTSADHNLVREEFRKRRLYRISDILKDLRQWRNQCDYDNNISGIAQKVQDAIKEAQEIFNRL